jgi:hypothetical protein
MATSIEERGSGWLAFAGVMLIISGALSVVNGLWALDRGGTVVDALYNHNLETWGWIYLIGGAIVILAGFSVFGRAQWARWVGVLVASISLIGSMFWVFQFSVQSLIVIFIDTLVIYALVVYGGREKV